MEMPLSSVSGFGCRQSLSSQSFALFATAKFTRLFIALFQFQPFEKAVVLNFLLQNAHCFFDVVVNNPDFNILQIPRPLLATEE
jgi:hypothetical protein